MKNEKAHYPFTYGDINTDEVRLSDYVVELMKTKRFQSHVTAMFFALLAIGSYAQPSSAIPTEYGEAANEFINQAGLNGPAGGVPVTPPIGQVEGQMPVVPGNTQCFVQAMPIEQQRILAAQQMGRQMPGMPPGMPPGGPGGPIGPPSFYIPEKPTAIRSRTINTAAFTAALGVVCLNAAWGEPVAIMMCSSGLVGLAYKLGKEVVLFMAKNIK